MYEKEENNEEKNEEHEEGRMNLGEEEKITKK